MSSKTTSFILLKSQKYRTCYAGRGLRSGVAVRGFVRMGPAAVAVERIAPTGRTAPKAPAGQSCWDDDISVTGHANMTLT